MRKAPTFRSSPEPFPHAPQPLPPAKPPLPRLLPLLRQKGLSACRVWGFGGTRSAPVTAAVAGFYSAPWPEFGPPHTSLRISDKGDRPWSRLAELGWIRRNTFSSFTG